MKTIAIASVLSLVVSTAAMSASEGVIVSVSTDGATPVSDDLIAEVIRAEVTNLSGADIKNVTLRPDGSTQAFATGQVLQYGALADGATRIVRGSVHRASSDAGGLEPVTWRLDFEEASGQHHRLYIATE